MSRGADYVAGDNRQPSCHGLLNHNRPGLAIARQNQDVGGMVCQHRLVTIQEASPNDPRPQTLRDELSQFVAEDSVADDQQVPIGPVVGDLGKRADQQVYPLHSRQAAAEDKVFPHAA